MYSKSKTIVTTITTYCLLAGAIGVSLLLPQTLSIPTVPASPPPDTITLSGVLRDFRSTHPDFNVPDSVVRGSTLR